MATLPGSPKHRDSSSGEFPGVMTRRAAGVGLCRSSVPRLVGQGGDCFDRDPCTLGRRVHVVNCG